MLEAPHGALYGAGDVGRATVALHGSVEGVEVERGGVLACHERRRPRQLGRLLVEVALAAVVGGELVEEGARRQGAVTGRAMRVPPRSRAT